MDPDTPLGAHLKSSWKIFVEINLKEAIKDMTLAAA